MNAKPAGDYAPAKLHPDELRLVSLGRVSRFEIPLSAVRRILVTPMPSLADEIGLVFEDEDGAQLSVRETYAEFDWLMDHFALERRLPAGWYDRVERGEVIAVDIEDVG